MSPLDQREKIRFENIDTFTFQAASNGQINHILRALGFSLSSRSAMEIKWKMAKIFSQSVEKISSNK